MASSVAKRVVGISIGFAYAFVYGVWTMFATGGGHGNFLWFLLFIYAEFLGFFFPIIGFAIPDLRPVWAKAIAIWSILANLFITVAVIIFGGVSQDIQKSWQRDPIALMFLALVHFVPLILLAIYVFSKASVENDDIEPFEDTVSILK